MAPRIIPRKEHRISRKQVSPNALRTLYRLHRRGFIAFLVGGCVRDLLLGRTPKDFDIGTNATPGQIKKLFHNCRLIGRRFRLAHIQFEGELLEVSTFRRTFVPSDAESPEETDRDSRLARHHITNEEGMVLVDNLFGTPEEDAMRRDFTINALAYNIADFSIIDYTSGLMDLKERLIRTIGDPRVRFTEDPVRMLRAVRFAASHGFMIEPVAWEVLCELSSAICRVSPARLYEEIQKLFLTGFSGPAFQLMEKSGLILALFPDLSRWFYGDSRRPALLYENLDYIDRLCRSGTPVSPAFFFAALFGPVMEGTVLDRHREGIPRRQALNETCAAIMGEVAKTITVPGRVGGRLRAILALQTFLCRMPPRRAASLAGRPEFLEAVAYLRLIAETKKDLHVFVEWWDAFLREPDSMALLNEATEEAPRKRRRRRRRKPRGPREDAT